MKRAIPTHSLPTNVLVLRPKFQSMPASPLAIIGHHGAPR